MKIKTSELIGAALDWAVAKCEDVYCFDGSYTPSTDWAQGGPIIEREFITIDQKERSICACIDAPDGHECNDIWANGPTPLIAAMRCRVASKLGDEIEIPEELK